MRALALRDEFILAPVPGPWGKALFALRTKHKLDRNKAALRADISPTTWGRLEKGGHTRTEKLQQIADKFHVAIDDVLVEPPGQAAQSSEPNIRQLHAQLETQQRQINALMAERIPRDAPHAEKARKMTPRKSLQEQLDDAQREATTAMVKAAQLKTRIAAQAQRDADKAKKLAEKKAEKARKRDEKKRHRGDK